MSLHEQFESLHPEIIESFRTTSQSDAIPENLQRYILLLDKVPELQRRYPSVSKCAKELIKLYPQFNIAFNTAREIIWEAINYFHLNSSVKNSAWNNYYADKLEELSNIAIVAKNFRVAERCLESAAKLRRNLHEDEIDSEKLRPIVHVLSPEVTWKMLGGKKEYNLKTIAGERLKQYKDACKEIDTFPVNTDEKNKLKEEAALSMNITDMEECEDE
jgi:tetratricopeptide (TPR) repeat protein